MTVWQRLTNTSGVSRGVVSWSAWGCALAFFLLGALPLYNIDAYGHLAQGRQIADLGYVPEVDLFSFWQSTPQPWSNYEWAYDLLTWLVYDGLGPNALIGLKCVALAALGYLLVILAYRLSEQTIIAAPVAAAVLLLFAPMARLRFTVRPQIVGLLLPAVLLVGIHAIFSPTTSTRRKAWIVAGLTAMHILWVNMHGSHLLGLLITALFLGFSFRTDVFKPILALLALQLGATACTPFGVSIVTDAVAHVFDPAYREIVIEWSPWSPDHPLYLLLGPVVAALLVLVAMRPVIRSGRFGTAYAVFCVVLSVMAFRSMRFVAHQLLLSAPLIAAGIAQMRWAQRLGRAVLVGVGASVAWAAFMSPRLEPFVPFGFGEPRLGHAWAAANVLNDHLKAPRILAPIQDSWPLMFAVPGGRFLVDGRVPFYGPKFIRKVTNSFSDPIAFQDLLARYDVNAVVVDHTRAGQAAAVEYLRRSPQWLLGQVQDRQSLYVRQDASGSLQPLQVVGPGYHPGRLLEPSTSDAEIQREVLWVGHHQNSTAIEGWIGGLRLLRPLARDGDRAGIRRHQTDDERQAARRAYAALTRAAQVYPGFTSIELYRGMAALSACDLDEARDALARAAYSGETRETALASLELVLRGGDESQRSDAIAEVERLLARPRAEDDPWLLALRQESDVRCP